MFVSRVLVAKASRFMAVPQPLYLPDVVAEIRDRYGFINYPRSPEEVLIPSDGSRAMVFTHGKVTHEGREIVVESLELYANAISVGTLTSTDDSDIILERFFADAAPRAVPVPGSPRVYVSQLEVMLTPPLDSASPLTNLGSEISRRFGKKVGREITPFRIASISMTPDPSTGSLIPADFRIDRRAGIPYDRELLFSQAPLSTRGHIEVLEEYERLLGGAVAKLP